MTKAKTKTVPRTIELRDRLKSIVESELDRFSELLAGLNDKERLDVILKLMPLVMPKSKPVHHAENEPFYWRSIV